jgi:cell division septation protein DedD
VTPTQTVTEAVPRTEEKTRPPTLETHEAQQPPAIPPKTQKQTASSPGNKTPSAPLMADTPPATHSTLPAPLTNGYYVQLGVFDATDNTNRLLENASALGLPAHVQSRVLVGPFRNKREAEAARSRLKELAKGIVVRPQKTAKAPNKPPAKSRRRARQTVGEQK